MGLEKLLSDSIGRDFFQKPYVARSTASDKTHGQQFSSNSPRKIGDIPGGGA